jgi:NADPH-dependent glutamate synthase beta subunit-like oxidoreductase
MESLNLQDRTRIGAMNQMGEVGRVTPCAPFFAPQESVVAAVGAQRTARPTLRFMESFNLQNWTRIGAMNLGKARRTCEQRAADVSSAERSRFCRQDAGSTLRFMESLNLQDRTRIGAMNQMGEVGRVTPCAPSFAPQESVVAAVGAQRTARPTLRFMESFNLQHWTRIGAMNPFSFVGPVFQPARPADWKVGVTAERFMESLLSLLRMHRDH